MKRRNHDITGENNVTDNEILFESKEVNDVR